MTDREEQATVQQQVAPRSLEVVTGKEVAALFRAT